MSEHRRSDIEHEIEQQRQAAAALEAQRAVLGEATVTAALTSIHRRISKLEQELLALAPATLRLGADERRQITVLQADVVGSTALAGSMDPEEWRAIMSEAHRRMRECVIAQGGVVGAVAGDGAVSYFGARQTREDDPHRALRAGLGIQRTMAEYSEMLRRERGIEFGLRLGIATGMVVIGQWNEHGLAAVGEPLVQANELEQHCRPGAVLCDLATARRTAQEFEVRPALWIDGQGTDHPGWEVLRERPRQPLNRQRARAIYGVTTPTVGRERELAALRGSWSKVMERRQPWAITLLGEPGLGKSRLLNEVYEMVLGDPRPIWTLTASGLAATAGVPFWLLRDLLATRAGLADNVPRDEAERIIVNVITELWPAAEGGEEAAHLFGYLSGFGFSESPHIQRQADDPRALRMRAFHLSEVWIRRLSVHYPIVFLIEDLHWIDGASLDWLAHLLLHLTDVPVLTVMTARRVFADQRPDWLNELPSHHALPLEPLDAQAGRALGTALLQRVDRLPRWLVERLVARAEGNPFYLEELVKTLIERDAIRVEESLWQMAATDELERALDAMPTGLQALVQSRLDALPPAEKHVVQSAAVVGRTFWQGAITHLVGPDAPDRLNQLVKRELISPVQSSSLANEQEYTFTHALLRDVAYEMLPRRVRRHSHAEVAAWLEQRATEFEVEHFAALLAEHYDHASEHERACHWYTLAGEGAVRAYANDLACCYYDRALELAPLEDHALRMKLLRRRYGVRAKIGDLNAEDADLTALFELAQASGNVVEQAEICMLRAVWSWKSAQASQGLRWAIAGRELLADQPPTPLLSRLLRSEGVCHYLLGDYRAALEVTQQALELAHVIGSWQDQGNSLNNLGMITLEVEGAVGAMPFYEQALALAESHEAWASMAVPLANLAISYERLGDYENALHFYRRSLEVDRRLGAKRGEASTLHNIGMLHWVLGDERRAMRHLEQSLASYRALGDRVSEGLALTDMALVLMRRGEHWEALIYARQGAAYLRDVEKIQDVPMALLVEAESLLALGELEQAQQVAEEARRMLAAIPDPRQAWALCLLAQIALGQDDEEGADHLSGLALEMGLQEMHRSVGPQHLWWVRFQVLTALGRSAEAQIALDQAHDQVLLQGVHIKSPALRQSFIEQVPVHLEIVRAWQQSLNLDEVIVGVQPAAA